MLWSFQPSLERVRGVFCLNTAKALPEYSVKKWVVKSAFSSKGFTLIELLAVVTLLGLLAAVAVSSLSGIEDDAALKLTRVEMSELRKALRQFKRDVGNLPDEVAGTYADEQERVKLLVKCSDDQASNPDYFDPRCNIWSIDTARGWNGPYVLSEGISDSWNTPYRLSFENLEPRLISHGPNK